MKLVYPIATPEISKQYMGLHGNFRDNIQALKDIGYEAVELCTCNPEKFDTDQLEAILTNSEVHVAAVATSHLINLDNLALQGVSPSHYSKAFKRLQKVIELAARFQAPLSIGKFRGNVADPANPDTLNRLASILRDVCDFAAHLQVDIMIEPQHSTNINNINSVEDGLRLLNTVQTSNLFLHLDTFHLNLTEPDPYKSITRAGDKVRFMHLADSERKIPGDGVIDLPVFFKALNQISYNGYLSFEIRQGDFPVETAREAFHNTMEIIRNQ